MVGVEPTVNRVETGNPTQNIDSRGSAGGSAPDAGGSKTDFLEAVRFIQSLPLTDAEKAQAVRRLLDGQAG